MNQQLDRKSARTLYEQLTLELREGLLSQFKVGEKIPTEDALVKRYQTSRSTVRRAIKDLVDDGILVRRQGKGTFVTRRMPKIVHEMDVLRPFYHTFREHGEAPSSEITAFAWCQRAEMPAGLGAQYESALFFRQVYRSAGLAHVVADVFLAPWIGDAVSRKTLEERPVFELYPDLTAGAPLTSRFTISCGATPGDVLEILDLSSGAVTLVMQRDTAAADGRMIDHAKLYLRADVYSISTVLRS